MRRIPIGLLSIGNFVAALGGGRILGMSSSALFPSWHTAPFVAFLLGTPIGLMVLRLLPDNRKALGTILSAVAAVCSVLLLMSYSLLGGKPPASRFTEAVIFAILCTYFGVWLVARVLRVRAAAGHIAYVEMSYYLGMICGLLAVHVHIGGAAKPLIDLPTALGLNVILQGGAALIDAYTVILIRRADAARAGEVKIEPSPSSVDDQLAYTRDLAVWPANALMVALIAVTIGTQMVIFGFASDIALGNNIATRRFGIGDEAEAGLLSTWLVSSIYIGSALAAIFCGYFMVRLIAIDTRREWMTWRIELGKKQQQSQPPTRSQNDGRWRLSLGFLNWSAAALVFCAIATRMAQGPKLLSVISSICAAILFEILFLALVEAIGAVDGARHGGKKNLVVWSYSFVAIAGGATLVAIVDVSQGNPIALFITLALSCCIAQLAFWVHPRKVSPKA